MDIQSNNQEETINLENCSICFDPLGKREDVICYNRIKECNHKFHDGCIFNWMQSRQADGYKDTCPYCRRPWENETSWEIQREQ